VVFVDDISMPKIFVFPLLLKVKGEMNPSLDRGEKAICFDIRDGRPDPFFCPSGSCLIRAFTLSPPAVHRAD
jgi:hypothetical protein